MCEFVSVLLVWSYFFEENRLGDGGEVGVVREVCFFEVIIVNFKGFGEFRFIFVF